MEEAGLQGVGNNDQMTRFIIPQNVGEKIIYPILSLPTPHS